MAYISSIGINNNQTCLMLENADNALNIIKTILFDEQYANDKTGQYAIMVSLEENFFRLDILDTFDDNRVVFGHEYLIKKHYTECEEVEE